MKKKLLIIEDETDLLQMLEFRAKKLGYEYKSDVVGDKAIAIAEEFKPDIILLDLMLPKISGLGVLRGIKNKPETKSIPIIVFSALADKYVVEEAMDIGASAYFIKGGDVNELFDTIREYVTE